MYPSSPHSVRCEYISEGLGFSIISNINPMAHFRDGPPLPQTRNPSLTNLFTRDQEQIKPTLSSEFVSFHVMEFFSSHSHPPIKTNGHSNLEILDNLLSTGPGFYSIPSATSTCMTHGILLPWTVNI